MAQLTNEANLEVTISGVSEEVQSAVTVELTDVYFDKTADKGVWTDGKLLYTVNIKNNGEAGVGEPFTDVTFTDTIQPGIATLVMGTVEVNDTILLPGQFVFEASTGLLTIPLSDIEAGEVVKITFQVERVL